MNIKMAGFVAGLLLLAGCSNDDKIFEEQGASVEGVKTFTSFTATLDESSDTRAYIKDGANKGNEVAWSENDSVFVFSDQQDATKFTLVSSTDKGGIFTGDPISGNKFTAVYSPGKWWREVTEPNTVYFSISGAEDDYESENHHATTANDFTFNGPMVATTTSNLLPFRQLTGMIHVSITDIHRLSFAELQGNKQEPVKGFYSLDLSNSSSQLQRVSPTITEEDPSSSSNSDDIWTRGWLFEKPYVESVADVYFVIPPTTFEEGFTVWIEGGDANDDWLLYPKHYNKPITIGPGEVAHFALVNVESELTEVLTEKETKNKTILKKIHDVIGGTDWYMGDNVPLKRWNSVSLNWNGEIKSLYLYGSNVKGEIPAAIGELTSLEDLVLTDVAITSLPEEIASLQNLRGLYISGTQLTELPESIGELKNLESLVIQNNALLTKLPESISGLKNLRTLLINNTRLTELPNIFDQLQNLETLYIANNSLLECDLPESIADLTNLRALFLYNNKFTGQIPGTYFTNLKNLEVFDLQGNKLNDQITKDQQYSPMWQSAINKVVSPQQTGFDVEIVNPTQEVELTDSFIQLFEGEKYQIKVKNIIPEDADQTLTYRDYNSRIISIDENGVVTALALGSTGVRVCSKDNNTYTIIEIQVVNQKTSEGNEKFDHKSQGW